MILLDIHAHVDSEKQSAGRLNLWQYCLNSAQDKLFFEQHQSEFFALGWHPWHLERDWKAKGLHFEQLAILAENTSVLALGETGLDSLISFSQEGQLEVFRYHIQLANRLNKPLILHSVRSHAAVLQELKRQKNAVPFIFHGFNRKKSIADEIIRAGGQLSFSNYIDKKSLADVFEKLPLSSIWLETDDKNTSLLGLYQLAATIKKISTEELAELMLKKFEHLFQK